uniref:Putative secreted protein n=1 Tax=Xenopsylla cheopis TaxID=163159 RepID=A0A6M2E070_XENCH
MICNILIFGVLGVLHFKGTFGADKECRDLHGRSIDPGLHYVPGPDTCTLCICDNGLPKWCKAVLCSPPQDCKSFRVGNSCCDFICLDDTLPKTAEQNEHNEVGL